MFRSAAPVGFLLCGNPRPDGRVDLRHDGREFGRSGAAVAKQPPVVDAAGSVNSGDAVHALGSGSSGLVAATDDDGARLVTAPRARALPLGISVAGLHLEDFV